MSPVLELKDVSYTYPTGNKALRNICLKIIKGKKIALVGPNGAGKSTLILLCNGMISPESGAILHNGHVINHSRSELMELRRRVGVVIQNSDAQIFAPTVWQDVAFGPLNLGYKDEEVAMVVSHALSAVGLFGFERRPPHLLSGGEKKRVAIAGVLAMEPEVMILDEPTSALDPAGAAEVIDLLDELNNSGTTIVISTHDVELAYQWADDVVLLDHGEIVHQGDPSGLFLNSELLKHARLQMPVILELYCELKARSVLLPGDPPKGVLDLTHRIDTACHKSPVQRICGKIYLCNADTYNFSCLQGIIYNEKITKIGAMGTRAKATAKKEGFDLDFTYGVIDKCILKALLSENALILTDSGMVKRIKERIGNFIEESGIYLTTIQLT